jgi:glycosyltransferase involved in cell wall biosynthesis
MPTTLLEAMQYGLSVVASDVGGVRDVLQNGENGLLVPPGQSEPLARALERLRDSATKREELATAARETAALYEWDQLGPRFAALLA